MVFVKKQSKLRYRFPISTELSTVFNKLYHHTNCFAFYSEKVIEDFSPLGDGSEVVVKEVAEIVVRMDGREEVQYLLSVHDMSQKFLDLFDSHVELKERLDFAYCYLKYNNEEGPVMWSHPLRKRRDDTINNKDPRYCYL